MNPKPIHNDEDYALALQTIDRLWDAADGTAEANTLEGVLNRRRPLSLAMMRKLQAGLGLPADVLVQPYALRSSRAPAHA
jgi:antitoxin component HigA of HigAB toxin-antitoxin module